MSKKILTVLAPVTALIAFAMVPGVASATSLQAPAGTPLGVNAPIQAQTANLVTKTSTGFELKCTGAALHGEVTASGGEDASVRISRAEFENPCPTNNPSTFVDVLTNAAISPWTLQIQQPEDPNMEQVTAHFSENVQISQQFQTSGGFSFATCNYTAPNLQFMGSTSSHVWTIEGASQFTLEQGSTPEAVCGKPHVTTFTLTGEFQFESGANKVFVDMT